MSQPQAADEPIGEADPSGTEGATRSGWREVGERGSVRWILALARIALGLGRAPARVILRVVAFYYTLFFRTGRRAVADFLGRVGEPVSFGRICSQMFRFAQVSLDALFLLNGEFRRFIITRDGHHYLDALRREKRGAVLLGAHLGSFYAMRSQSEDEKLSLHPLVYTQNAQRYNAVLDALAPGSGTRVIGMQDGDVSFVLTVRRLVDEGGLIAILADRVPKDGRAAEVSFLGGRARFPVGPYALAAMLRCPVYFVCGIYREPNRYELHCEPFADRIELPRGRREEALAAYAQQYADVVARYVRGAPDNWFNFYDFWAEERAGEHAPERG